MYRRVSSRVSGRTKKESAAIVGIRADTSTAMLTAVTDQASDLEADVRVVTAMFGRIVGVLVVAAVVSIEASAQQSFRQFESASEFERALAAVDAIKHRKKFQCVITIANGKLCECLSRELPVDTYVRSYASIVSLGSEGSEYGQLSATDKKIVDQCVSDNP